MTLTAFTDANNAKHAAYLGELGSVSAWSALGRTLASLGRVAGGF
jgi:hypothetical protein